MAVGTTSDHDVTRNTLIRSALRLCGVHEATNAEMSDALESLNALIRHIDLRADWLHAISNTLSTLTLVSNQQAYAAGSGASLIATNILKLEYAAILVGTQKDPPLIIFDKPTSLSTPLQDDTAGQPIAVYLETAKLFSSQRMLFYPTPNSAYTVKYNFRRPLYDFDTVSDNPDFPAAFILPFKKLLANELATEYSLPIPERDRLLGEGEKALNEALAGNSEKPAYETLKTEYY